MESHDRRHCTVSLQREDRDAADVATMSRLASLPAQLVVLVECRHHHEAQVVRPHVVLLRLHALLPLQGKVDDILDETDPCTFRERSYRSQRLPGKKPDVHHDGDMYL